MDSVTASDDKGLMLFAQNSCNWPRPSGVKAIPDLAVQERLAVSDTMNVQEVCTSSDSVAKAITMSLPCCVLRVAVHELVVFGQPTAADPSTAKDVGPLAFAAGITPSGTNAISKASTIIIVADSRLLDKMVGTNATFLTK